MLCPWPGAILASIVASCLAPVDAGWLNHRLWRTVEKAVAEIDRTSDGGALQGTVGKRLKCCSERVSRGRIADLDPADRLKRLGRIGPLEHGYGNRSVGSGGNCVEDGAAAKRRGVATELQAVSISSDTSRDVYRKNKGEVHMGQLASGFVFDHPSDNRAAIEFRGLRTEPVAHVLEHPFPRGFPGRGGDYRKRHAGC